MKNNILATRCFLSFLICPVHSSLNDFMLWFLKKQQNNHVSDTNKTMEANAWSVYLNCWNMGWRIKSFQPVWCGSFQHQFWLPYFSLTRISHCASQIAQKPNQCQWLLYDVTVLTGLNYSPLEESHTPVIALWCHNTYRTEVQPIGAEQCAQWLLYDVTMLRWLKYSPLEGREASCCPPGVIKPGIEPVSPKPIACIDLATQKPIHVASSVLKQTNNEELKYFHIKNAWPTCSGIAYSWALHEGLKVIYDINLTCKSRSRAPVWVPAVC